MLGGFNLFRSDNKFDSRKSVQKLFLTGMTKNMAIE